MRTTLFCLLLAACASTPPAANRADAPERRIDLPRVVITPDETHSVASLMETGFTAARAGEHRRAAEHFELAARSEPNGPYAAAAAFNAGEARDLLREHERALSHYRSVAERYPTYEHALMATVRCVRLATFLEDWVWAGRFADRALERQAELSSLSLVVVHAGKALSLVGEGDDVRAASFIERGRNVVEQKQLDLAGKLPPELAPLYFALGEVYRLRAERIHFNPTPPDFAVVLERRCQLILDAQRAYSDTWRSYDSHWSTLAGFRLGEMYAKLHQELVAIPAPATADNEKRRQLFEGAMRLRYSVLLEKARGMLEHTVAMAEREGERSSWVQQARSTLDRIRAAEVAERESIDRLPYSRQQLEEVLTDIQRRAKAAQSGKNPPQP